MLKINDQYSVEFRENKVQVFENGKPTDHFSGEHSLVVALVQRILELENELDEVDVVDYFGDN